MKYSILFFAGILTACNTNSPAKSNPVKDSPVTIDTATPVAVPVAVAATTLPAADSNIITGDFNGDGQTESAFVVLAKRGNGNPVEDGVPDEYALRFSDSTLPAVNIGCCEARLINEGDLNSDNADEVSVFQAPPNGNTYKMSTWTFDEQRWRELSDPFLIPTGGDFIADRELQKRVFLENHILYFLDTDLNDEHLKLVKKKAMLR